MDTFQPEEESEPPGKTSTMDVNNTHMVYSTHEVKDFHNNSLDGTIVLNPKHCDNIGHILKQMQERSEMCDICLRIEDLEKTIPAHKCILAANSPVFCAILQSVEGNEVCMPSFDNVPGSSFYSILSYMYTGQLTLNLFNVESILKLSSHFEIPEIARLCSKYIQDAIDITNWAYLQNLTTLYDLGVETELKISEFVADNLPFLVHSDGIVGTTPDELLHILGKENTRKESEIEACKLEIILKWLLCDPSRMGRFCDLIQCIDISLLRMMDIDRLKSTYSSLITSLPQSSWVAFEESVCGNKRQICDSMESTETNLDHKTDFSEHHVGEHYKTDAGLFDAEVSIKLSNESDREFLRKIKTEEDKEENTGCLKEAQTIQRKGQNKRKARYPVKLRVDAKKLKKGSSNSRVKKQKPKQRKPRMKAACTQVNFKEEHKYVGIPEKPVQTSLEGEPDHDHCSDAECVGYAPEIWREGNELSDTENIKAERVSDLQNPEVIIIEHHKIKGRIQHRILNVADSTPTKEKRIRAKKATTEEEMYQCEKCPRKFVTPSALRHHMKGHGATQPFLCEICGFSTIHIASMNVHKRQHNDQLRYHCTWPGCDYTAIRRSRLEDHLAAHNGIKNFVCSTCGKAFSGRKHLHRHEQIHKDFKVKCTMCNYESPRKDKLRDHMKKHHPETALLQGIMTTEEMQKAHPILRPQKPHRKKTKKKTKMDIAETGEDFRHEEDQKAASVLQSESILTGDQSAFSTTLPPGYIPILTGTQPIPEELLQYIPTIAIAPVQQHQQANNTTFLQPGTSQQFLVTDSTAAVSPSESVTFTTTSQSSDIQPTVDQPQHWYYVYPGQDNGDG